MSIIRRKRQDGFAIVPNSVANDERLSFEERGLLVYLLAKPADWEVNVVDLMRQGGIGRDKTYRLLNGLIAAGYVRRERQLDPDTKRVKSYDYTVSDVADLSNQPLPENQEMDPEPLPDLPDTENQDTYKEQKKTKTYSPLSPPGGTRKPPARRRRRQQSLFGDLRHHSGNGTEQLPNSKSPPPGLGKVKVSSVDDYKLFRRCEEISGGCVPKGKDGSWWFPSDVVQRASSTLMEAAE